MKWRVALYLGQRASPAQQQQALGHVFSARQVGRWRRWRR
jgi:hypothetical protein